MREDHRQRRDHSPRIPMGAEHDGSPADLLDRCKHYFSHRISPHRTLNLYAKTKGALCREVIWATDRSSMYKRLCPIS